MRYLLRTSYDQDVRLFRDGRPQMLWHLALLVALLVAPAILPGYLVSLATFVFIYATAAIGLQILLGFCGQVSLGQAALVAIGAYACVFLERVGVPFAFALPVAALITAATGAILFLPVLRLRGLYLAVATMSLGFIIEEVAARWTSVTGGNAGVTVPPARLLGLDVSGDRAFYYLCLAAIVGALALAANVARAPIGRAMAGVRDSLIAAQTMGVHAAGTKTIAFALSALLAGFAGGLYAHKLGYISPEQFTLSISIELLIMVLIGGLASLRGAVLGAAFIVLVPEVLHELEGFIPGGSQPALRPMVFGLLLVFVMLFEPRGLNGLVEKATGYLRLLPLYRRGMFKRQRAFAKSERW